ncbi:uncharacterized protein LOC127793186 [Diospyros lotus]|uniref:uncharacterized protein LOC127793186 n=1 Tax=Diospyros lotus TaxID=55363 RepID=UPI002255360B|nr:uncharacterized protein LOC127793186 [Diospyros lotus]
MEDEEENVIRRRDCGCLPPLCILSGQIKNRGGWDLLDQLEEGETRRESKGTQKAMIKWKNYLMLMMRRIRSMDGKMNKKKRRSMKFSYDPRSYALNFDDDAMPSAIDN